MSVTVTEKRPGSKLLLNIDVSNLLPEGVTVSSIKTSVAAEKKDFASGSSAVTISGEAVDSDSDGVDFFVEGGTDREVYVMSVTVNGSNSEEYIGEGVLLVREVV